ncbi:MAG: hypothetical protein JRH20_31690 [Deltaproteobacteria bacterium]|nr:hypothetical protein [Deltaproteobacteria bacterium]
MRSLLVAGLLTLIFGVGTSHAGHHVKQRVHASKRITWKKTAKAWRHAFKPLKLTKQDYANYGPDAAPSYVRFVQRVTRLADAVLATPVLGKAAKKINRACASLNCLLPGPTNDLGYSKGHPAIKGAARKGGAFLRL